MTTVTEAATWREQGDRALHKHGGAVYRVIEMNAGRLPPDLDREDVAQELRLHLYRKFHKYDAGRHVQESTFVFCILQRRLESVLSLHLRRGFRGVPAATNAKGRRVDGVVDGIAEFVDAMGGESDPEGGPPTEWTQAQWRAVLDRIPVRKWRECVEMVYRFRMPHAAVAWLMGINSVERIRQHVSAGLVSLSARSHLYDEDDFPAPTKYPVREQLERSRCVPEPERADASAVKHNSLFSDIRCYRGKRKQGRQG